MTEVNQRSVGSDSMLHSDNKFILQVAYNMSIWMDVFTASKCHEDKEVTHVLSVAMRQRHIPSRERKFLCLKPGSNLSQMY